ncbi:IS66 family insertion sequence element accessory protein TnpA [Paraburkholderia sp. A1RI-2L]|uniref:IS66 family insertion sequence element accessory protein TnpA n=1 Tax=Paraburkholderia sp. A1RI-2L TaxID=3028367 RepID=UPI003BA069C7
MLLVQCDQEQTMKAAAKREEVELAWRQRLARFAERGLTVRAFCREESVSEFRFYHWRRRLQGLASPCGVDASAGDSALSIWGPLRQLTRTSTRARRLDRRI